MRANVDMLRRMLAEGRYGTVYREFGDESKLCGYVVDVRDELLTVEKFHDFYSEGLSVVRLEHVTRVEAEEREDFFGAVIAAEGLRMPEEAPREHLGSFTAVLEWAMSTGQLVGLHRETHIGHDGDFSVGRVLARDGDAFTLRDVSARGVWYDDDVLAEPETLTQIELLTPYLRYFARYAREE